jgi:arylsulfatase A-like enzyme
MIRSTPRLWLLACGLALLAQEVCATARPNVLLIVTDDQRPDTIGALGNTLIQTPALDRLVRDGTVLSGMTCAFPVCVPSRTELLTGRIFAKAVARGAPQPPTLAEGLRAAGYRTWHVGKWHVAGKPTTRGYVESRGLFAETSKRPLPPPERNQHGEPITGYRGWVFQNDAGDEFPEFGVGLTPNISERFADAAIELIRGAGTEPFFLHLNFTAPHDPRLLPAGFEHRYPPERMNLPANFSPEPTIKLETRDERLLPRPLPPARVREELAIYYALVSHLDTQIGRVLAALRTAGHSDDTIVIFTSDHGLALGSHGLLGKQNLYDHTLRVPCLLAGPGIPPGSSRPGLALLRDLGPTILELCGVKIPAGLDAVSLVGLIRGTTAEVHPFVTGYYLDEFRAVRTPRWKWIALEKEGREQLFDLEHDPHEMRNLSTEPAYAATVAEMKRRWDQWLAEHGPVRAGPGAFQR